MFENTIRDWTTELRAVGNPWAQPQILQRRGEKPPMRNVSVFGLDVGEIVHLDIAALRELPSPWFRPSPKLQTPTHLRKPGVSVITTTTG